MKDVVFAMMLHCILADLLVAGCSGAITGNEPVDLSDATGNSVRSTNTIGVEERPLVVEWPAAEKVNLRATSENGTVVVAYRDGTLNLLTGCIAPGYYSSIETARSSDSFTMRSAAEVHARVPIGAVSLTGELSSNKEITLSYVAIGKRVSSVERVSRQALEGTCEGATHIVRGMVYGAYELQSGSGMAVRSGVGVKAAEVGGGGEKSKTLLKRDGEFEVCSNPDTPSDDPRCQAIVQLDLSPIDAEGETVSASALGCSQEARKIKVRVMVEEESLGEKATTTAVASAIEKTLADLCFGVLGGARPQNGGEEVDGDLLVDHFGDGQGFSITGKVRTELSSVVDGGLHFCRTSVHLTLIEEGTGEVVTIVELEVKGAGSDQKNAASKSRQAAAAAVSKKITEEVSLLLRKRN